MSSYAYAANSVEINYTLSQCDNINLDNFYTKLNNIIEISLRQEIGNQDNIKEKVNAQWNFLHLSDTIDSEIDKAAYIIKENTSWKNKITSNWNKDKIKELTNEVVMLAFDSPSSEIKSKVNILSKNVGNELSESIGKSTEISSSQVVSCLRKSIGQRYSQTMLSMFDRHLESLHTELSMKDRLSTPSIGDVNRGKVVGVGIVSTLILKTAIKDTIKNRITNRITTNITERIFGRLAFIEIPFIGEAIAIISTIWDISQGLDGALPIIQEKLKEPELKLNFRQQIVTEFERELLNKSPLIAGEITNEIHSQWIEFKDNHHQALEIAEGSPKFRNILDKASDRGREKLFLLVGTLLNITGHNQLLEYIEDGKFEQLYRLPESTYQVLTNIDNISEDRILSLIQWVDLAGNRLEEVISTELYKHLSPKDLDRQLLISIISIQDPATINKLALLDLSSIRKLMLISKQNLIELATKTSLNDLQIIANYLNGLEQIDINRIVKFLLDEKALNSNVLSHIIKSRNITTAIEFWRQPNFLIGISSFLTGNICWELLTERYGLIIILPLPLFCLLILLIIIWYVGYAKDRESNKLKES